MNRSWREHLIELLTRDSASIHSLLARLEAEGYDGDVLTTEDGGRFLKASFLAETYGGVAAPVDVYRFGLFDPNDDCGVKGSPLRMSATVWRDWACGCGVRLRTSMRLVEVADRLATKAAALECSACRALSKVDIPLGSDPGTLRSRRI